MISRNEARQLVRDFDPSSERMSNKKDLVLKLLEGHEDPFSRDSFNPGQITASAVVLSPAGDAVLLVHHRRLSMWLQPGGHVERGDDSLVAAAMREATEETHVSIAAEAVELIGLDVHDIPAARGEPDHLHHDLAFKFTALSPEIISTDENHAVTWCKLDQMDLYDLDTALREYVYRAFNVPDSNRRS